MEPSPLRAPLRLRYLTSRPARAHKRHEQREQRTWACCGPDPSRFGGRERLFGQEFLEVLFHSLGQHLCRRHHEAAARVGALCALEHQEATGKKESASNTKQLANALVHTARHLISHASSSTPNAEEHQPACLHTGSPINPKEKRKAGATGADLRCSRRSLCIRYTQRNPREEHERARNRRSSTRPGSTHHFCVLIFARI